MQNRLYSTYGSQELQNLLIEGLLTKKLDSEFITTASMDDLINYAKLLGNSIGLLDPVCIDAVMSNFADILRLRDDRGIEIYQEMVESLYQFSIQNTQYLARDIDSISQLYGLLNYINSLHQDYEGVEDHVIIRLFDLMDMSRTLFEGALQRVQLATEEVATEEEIEPVEAIPAELSITINTMPAQDPERYSDPVGVFEYDIGDDCMNLWF
jgi:hypothetical protein